MDQTNRPHENCYWLAPRLMAGEYPGAPTVALARPRLQAILDAGVSFFVDLTMPGELVAYELLLPALAGPGGREVQHRRLPIRDLGVPRRAEMVAILDTIDGALAAGETVYFHCWGGIGRTGTVAGCWLVRHGATGAAALATVAERFATVGKASRLPRSPETEEQMAYVMRWRE
jgi:hypothetical protein